MSHVFLCSSRNKWIETQVRLFYYFHKIVFKILTTELTYSIILDLYLIYHFFSDVIHDFHPNLGNGPQSITVQVLLNLFST